MRIGCQVEEVGVFLVFPCKWSSTAYLKEFPKTRIPNKTKKNIELLEFWLLLYYGYHKEKSRRLLRLMKVGLILVDVARHI